MGGTYAGAVDRRDTILRLAVPDSAPVATVTLNGEALPRFENEEELDRAEQGWTAAGPYWIVIRLGIQGVSEEKVISIR
jgi:hypothetical protein